MDSDDAPTRRHDHAAALATDDLAPLSVAELESRVALLEAEVARVRAHQARALNHRASADALFRR